MIKVGDDGDVEIRLPKDATGTVIIEIEGNTYTAKVFNGKASFSIPGLTEGVHKVHVSYSGDSNYPANETETVIVVNDNHDGNHTHIPGHGDGVPLSQYKTGNPILILLLIVLAIGTTQIRRLK